jgi:hypothetical protein
MIYQLPNGKIINISIDTYLRMSDDDFRYLNDSEFGSSIGNKSPFEVSEDTTESLDIIADEYLEDLPEDLEFPDSSDLDD